MIKWIFDRQRFTTVETILASYFAYWTIVLVSPQISFSTYSIYGNLALMFSETVLTYIMLFVFGTILIGQIIGSKRLRMLSLMLSMLIWGVIALSFIQQDWESMRGSVIILAVASGYQFVKVSRTPKKVIPWTQQV